MVDYEWRIRFCEGFIVEEEYTLNNLSDNDKSILKDPNVEVHGHLIRHGNYDVDYAFINRDKNGVLKLDNLAGTYKVPNSYHEELAHAQGFQYVKPITIKINKKVKKIDPKYVDYVKTIALKCTKYLIENGMLKKPMTFEKKLKVHVKRTRLAWGGINQKHEPTITITESVMSDKGRYHEYRSIAKIKGIGEFHSDDSDDHINAEIAHEMAHACDIWNGSKLVHGSEWRVVYRALRTHLNVPQE